MPKLSKHKLLEVERRQATVGELACKGWSQQRIALELGVSQTLVSRDIRECRKKWREDLTHTVEESIAYEIAKLTMLERMAHEGYANSCRDTITKDITVEKAARGSSKKGKAGGKDGEEVPGGEAETNTQAPPQTLDGAIKVAKDDLKIIKLLKKKSSKTNGAGDVRFLELAFKCVTAKLEMLGAMGKDGFTLCLNQQVNGELSQGLASLGWAALYKKQLVETDDVEEKIKAMEDKAALVQSGVPVDEGVEEIMHRLNKDKIAEQLTQPAEDE